MPEMTFIDATRAALTSEEALSLMQRFDAEYARYLEHIERALAMGAQGGGDAAREYVASAEFQQPATQASTSDTVRMLAAVDTRIAVDTRFGATP